MTSRIIDNRPGENFADVCHYHLAKTYYEVLVKNIHNFKQHLNLTQEIGVAVTQGEHTQELFLDSIQYSDPNLLIIIGEDFNGKPIELIQDASHLSLTLLALPRRSVKGLLIEAQEST